MRRGCELRAHHLCGRRRRPAAREPARTRRGEVSWRGDMAAERPRASLRRDARAERPCTRKWLRAARADAARGWPAWTSGPTRRPAGTSGPARRHGPLKYHDPLAHNSHHDPVTHNCHYALKHSSNRHTLA